MAAASANGIRIEYESFGSNDAPVIVLIMGLGMQLIAWPDPFCQKLAAAGFRVIRFDNRDIGLSTYFDDRGVPNMAWIFGYFRAASWTLRVDLVADFVCRLLQHMDRLGARQVNVTLRDQEADMELLPWIDGETFSPGYLMRDVALLPKRGDKPEWEHSQDYWWEKDALPKVDLTDPLFLYDGRPAVGEQPGA